MELLVGESGGLIGGIKLLAASFEVSTSFDCFSTTFVVVPVRGC